MKKYAIFLLMCTALGVFNGAVGHNTILASLSFLVYLPCGVYVLKQLKKAEEK